MPTALGPLRPVRVLVIGAGPASTAMHLPVLARLRDLGEIVLAVICDIQPERAAAARLNFGFLEDTGEASAALERRDIDAVYIFGSAQLHYEHGATALCNGRHLFVEKPIAPSYSAARALAQLARARGLIAAGGHNRRFYKSLETVRARAGRTGWRYAEAAFHKPEFGNPAPFGARTWLSANGIHGLDVLVFMMGGLPEHVAALAGDDAAEERKIFSAVMRWPDGGQGVFLCNNTAGSRREEYSFHGPGESLSVTETGLIVANNGSMTTTSFPSPDDGVYAEHAAFLQAVRTGKQPPHAIAALAPSIFLAELIEAGFNGPVRLPEAEPQIAAARPLESILVARSAGLQPALERFLPQFRLLSIEDLAKSDGQRPDVVAAILEGGSPPLTRDLLDKLPRLGIVGVSGLSLTRHQPELLLARNIALVNASEAYADSVAEFALGLAILGRRRAFLSHQLMRTGGWGVSSRSPGLRNALQRAAQAMRPAAKAARLETFLLRLWRASRPVLDTPGPRPAPARDLADSVVGLIGWGANARAFTLRLRQARARVLVYSEHAAVADIESSGALPASLAEVLAADIVSLHRGLNSATHHFLGAAELAKLRSGSVLINVARGALIEPGALLGRLKQGDIFACLDTFDQEPLAASHPLRKLRNVFLTSHIAGGSPGMHAAAAEEVARKVAAHVAGDKVDSISAERLRTMT